MKLTYGANSPEIIKNLVHHTTLPQENQEMRIHSLNDPMYGKTITFARPSIINLRQNEQITNKTSLGILGEINRNGEFNHSTTPQIHNVQLHIQPNSNGFQTIKEAEDYIKEISHLNESLGKNGIFIASQQKLDIPKIKSVLEIIEGFIADPTINPRA